jgi:hypothetical protein
MAWRVQDFGGRAWRAERGSMTIIPFFKARPAEERQARSDAQQAAPVVVRWCGNGQFAIEIVSENRGRIDFSLTPELLDELVEEARIALQMRRAKW